MHLARLQSPLQVIFCRFCQCRGGQLQQRFAQQFTDAYRQIHVLGRLKIQDGAVPPQAENEIRYGVHERAGLFLAFAQRPFAPQPLGDVKRRTEDRR